MQQLLNSIKAVLVPNDKAKNVEKYLSIE